MNIKQVRYFVSVYRNGSLSAAAKEQYVTVQAVSKAIADLEREVSRPLFTRESRGVRPTPFGDAFFAKSGPALEGFDELEAFAHGEEVQPGAALRLALCTPTFHRADRACASIASFTARQLGIDVTVDLMPLATGVSRLHDGSLDGLFAVGSCEAEGVDRTVLGTVSPGLVMAADHPLASRASITLEDMRRYPVATAGDFDSFNVPVANEYRSRGIEVKSLLDAEEFERHTFAERGMSFAAGVSALGQMHPGCVLRLVAPADAIAVPLCLVSERGRTVAALRMMERWLTAELRAFGGDSIKKIAALATAGPRGDHRA